MLYYTLYMKSLSNGTGYIDIALPDDQLLKDYLQFLDLGVRTQRVYSVSDAKHPGGSTGGFTVDLAQIAAIITNTPTK